MDRLPARAMKWETGNFLGMPPLHICRSYNYINNVFISQQQYFKTLIFILRLRVTY